MSYYGISGNVSSAKNKEGYGNVTTKIIAKRWDNDNIRYSTITVAYILDLFPLFATLFLLTNSPV